MTMSSSLKEDEKLRKRLQKLFQQQVLKQSTAGKGSSYSHLPKKVEMNKIPKTKITEDQQIKESSVKSSRFISKNNKKRLVSQTKSMETSTDARQHNGFVKASGKKKPNKKFSKGANLRQTKSLLGNNLNEHNFPIKTKSPIKTLNKKRVKTANIQHFENNTARTSQEIDQSSISKQSLSGKNGPKKFDKNQEKKGKKRSVSADTVNSNSLVSKKKQKLSKKYSSNINKTPTKSNQRHELNADKSLSSPLQYNNEHDVNNVIGYVRGGDFETNYEEDYRDNSFWPQEESLTETDYSSDDISERYNSIQKLKQNYQDLYDYNECLGSDDEFFDSDYDNDTFDDCYSISDGRIYSDIDDNDYKENDEDCYSFSIQSDDYFSNYESDMFYDSDEDYKLPEHVAEDLIIHRGTATKHDLKPEDNVVFNSDNEESQIVELETGQVVKVIYQPKAYDKEELLKLKYEEKSSSSVTVNNNDPEDCPTLVPILNDDGFQLFPPNDEICGEEETEQRMNNEQTIEEYDNDDMYDINLDSEYSEINSDDADSMLSEDINEKYFSTDNNGDNSDNNIDEDLWSKKHKPDVIDARENKYESKVTNSNDNSNISLNDDIKQIPSFKLYENVDLGTESTILSITIIDDETNTIDKELYAKSDKIQKVPFRKSESEPTEENMDKLEMEKQKITEDSSNISKFVGQSLADYNTKFFNAFDSNLVIVLLRDPFYIYGTLRLTLLAGTVEVYGHNLSFNTEVEIFSPRGCSVIEISSSRGKINTSNENLKQILKTFEKNFALADLKAIASFYNSETDAVVLLRRNETRKKVVQQFKKFMNENMFPNINNINVDRPLYNSEYLLRCMINTSAQEQKCLRLPEHWSQFNITSKCRVMLAGGKSVGKSTLLRYLINRYVPQQLLLIDLDIGQPEFFIPQTISCTIVKQPVLGPGFLLNLQPDIAYAVGHTNIALCAHKYIAAVRSLIAHCKAQKEYQDLPWLINTMGYNKGFGLELISAIAQEIPLTDIIQLQSNKEINNFDSLLEPQVLSSVPKILFSEDNDDEETTKEELIYRLHVWQSAVQQESRYHKEWEMSAKDLRFAMLLTRLSEALQGHAEWLTDVKPLSASFSELRIINLMNNSSLSSVVHDLEKSLEANLVYLCQYEEDLKPLKCLGIGIVRAVDYHLQKLYLVPALPYTQLKEVNCLAIGEMPLPTSLFTNQGPKIKNTTPFVYNTILDNNSKAIKQIYHRPSKFLTGKHKSFK